MKPILPAALLALTITPAFAQDTTFDFSGAYVGFSLGKQNSDSFNSANVVNTSSNSVGLEAGYLFDLGGVLVGGDLSYRRFNYTGTNVTTATALNGTITGSAVGVKVGYPIGQIMPYLGARVGRGTDDTGAGTLDFSSQEIAIGAEYALTDTISTSISLEQLTLDYQTVNLNVRSRSVSVGINYRF